MIKFKVLPEPTTTIFGVTLYRIQAISDIPIQGVKEGDIGGFVESAYLQNGEPRISDNAWVFGDAWISDNARIYDDASVSGQAHIDGNARIYGKAHVYGSTWVSGNTKIFGHIRLSSNVKISGNSVVSDDSETTYTNTTVPSNPIPPGTGVIHNNTQVCPYLLAIIVTGFAIKYCVTMRTK